MSSTCCELRNIIRPLFVPKIHDFRSSGGRSAKTPRGYQNLTKLIDFEFRVVRSPSYLVVMEYPWVLRVASFGISSEHFSSQKSMISARAGEEALKPQGVPKSHKINHLICGNMFYRLRASDHCPINFRPKYHNIICAQNPRLESFLLLFECTRSTSKSWKV